MNGCVINISVFLTVNSTNYFLSIQELKIFQNLTGRLYSCYM